MKSFHHDPRKDMDDDNDDKNDKRQKKRTNPKRNCRNSGGNSAYLMSSDLAGEENKLGRMQQGHSGGVRVLCVKNNRNACNRATQEGCVCGACKTRELHGPCM